MRIIMGFFVLAVALSPLKAQDDRLQDRAAVKWGNTYEEPSGSDIQKIIATEGGGFYALRTRYGGVFGTGSLKAIVEYYDKNMKLVKSNELDLDYKGKERSLKDVVMLEGKLWLLTYFYNQKQEITYLFAQNIKKNTLVLDKNLIKIAQQDVKNLEKTDVFQMAISRDSSKIAIINSQPNEKNQDAFDVNVYDSEFQTIWHKSANLPFPAKSYDIEEYQVDNKGNVYFLSILSAQKAANRFSRRAQNNYQYSIVAFRQEENVQMTEYKIAIPEKFISDLTYRVTESGDLICAGFYSDKGVSGIKGTCYFRINSTTQEMTNVNTRPFDFDFMTTNLSARKREKARQAYEKNDVAAQPELYDYALDKLILRSDGGVILIAEQYYIEEVYRNNNMMNYPYAAMGGFYNPYYYNRFNNRVDYFYHYNDIIVVNIQPDGTIAWSARVPKQQISSNDQGLYSSYAMNTVADKLCFIFNDDPNNVGSRVQYQTNSESRNTVVTVAEVDRDGKVTRYPLFQNKEEGIMTRPKICRQIGRRDMALYGEKGRAYRFGLLSFQ